MFFLFYIYFFFFSLFIFFIFYLFFSFFFNDTATTEIYTLSLHDALPIWSSSKGVNECEALRPKRRFLGCIVFSLLFWAASSEDSRWARCIVLAQPQMRADPHRKGGTRTKQIGRAHVWTPVTLIYLVCRLLLEKKKTQKKQKKK